MKLSPYIALFTIVVAAKECAKILEVFFFPTIFIRRFRFYLSMHELTLWWIFSFFKVSAAPSVRCHLGRDVTIYRQIEYTSFSGSKPNRGLQIVSHSRDIRFSQRFCWRFRYCAVLFNFVIQWHYTTFHTIWTFSVAFTYATLLPINYTTCNVKGGCCLMSNESTGI